MSLISGWAKAQRKTATEPGEYRRTPRKQLTHDHS